MTPIFTLNPVPTLQASNQPSNRILYPQFQTQMPIMLNKRPNAYEFTDTPIKCLKLDPISAVPVSFLQDSQHFLPVKRSIADKIRLLSAVEHVNQLRPTTAKSFLPISSTAQIRNQGSGKFNFIKTSIREYCVNQENVKILQNFPAKTSNNALPVAGNGQTRDFTANSHTNPTFVHNHSRQRIIQVIHEEIQEEEALKVIPYDLLMKYNLIPITNTSSCSQPAPLSPVISPKREFLDEEDQSELIIPPVEVSSISVKHHSRDDRKTSSLKMKYHKEKNPQDTLSVQKTK